MINFTGIFIKEKNPVLKHIKSDIPTTLDPFQYTYSPNHSMSAAIRLRLTHLDKKGQILYVRTLFMDFRLAFKTIQSSQSNSQESWKGKKTAQITSSSLLKILKLWASRATVISQQTWSRWSSLLNGVETTVSISQCRQNQRVDCWPTWTARHCT